MNHARLLMVSAIASALAACGGGGGDDNTSGATSTSSANNASTATPTSASSSAPVSTPASASTSASAPISTSAATAPVNVEGLTLPAARQAVEQANEETATAQEQLTEARMALAAERAQAEAARELAAQAAAQAAAADAQNKADAEQAAREAAAREEALQRELAEAQAAAERAEAAAKAEADKLAEAEAKLAEVARRDEQTAAPAVVPATEIPDCSRNAAAVDDPETGLKLVCESQITSGATTADVGTAKHASGRYYALPFPDKSMMFVGKKATYKMACGEFICEWLKVGGKIDAEYAAQGKDGNYYRFTSCRAGRDDKVICLYPGTGRPDGVTRDDREPEAPRIGARITDTDTSGKRRFRAHAETRSTAGCSAFESYFGRNSSYVFPWPDKDLFRQNEYGTWEALFDGGNCLGDVRVSLNSGTPEAPDHVHYAISSGDWPFEKVAGPDGKEMEFVIRFPRWRVTSAQEARQVNELLSSDPASYYESYMFRHTAQR